MKRRSSSGYITVDTAVDVRVDELLESLTDEDLLQEMKSRNIELPRGMRFAEIIEDLRAAYDARDGMHFDVLLIRLRALLVPEPKAVKLTAEKATAP